GNQGRDRLGLLDIVENDLHDHQQRHCQDHADDAPDNSPERQRQEDEQWADVEPLSRDARLDDGADALLDPDEQDRDDQPLPGFIELHEAQEDGEGDRDEAPEVRNVVEQENQNAPGGGEIDIEQGQDDIGEKPRQGAD